MNPALILLPMLAVVALTFAALFRLAFARARAVKSGMDTRYYRAYQGTPEPEPAATASRHYSNLFEMAVLFHVACLTGFALHAVSRWTLAFAWAYVACRLAQSAVHMTYNNPAHRGLAFAGGVACMIALWVNLALSICARI
jgi:hypothetical protein